MQNVSDKERSVMIMRLYFPELYEIHHPFEPLIHPDVLANIIAYIRQN